MTDSSCRAAMPSPSATLILARRREAEIEVYLLRRSAASKFMPGTYVFPGGNLEAEDMNTAFWQKHVDLTADRLALALNGEVDRMLPFAVAAIRETWEEAGLLLAAPMKGSSDPEHAGNTGTPFIRRIQDGGLALSVSKLGRWHHWITPEMMPRRFDTFFFVAPVGQNRRCQPDNHETVHGTWINPRKALTENARGTLPLSPPTLVTLHQMLSFADFDTLIAESRSRSWPDPIMPRLWPLDQSALIIEPWDPDYARETVSVAVGRLEADVLPVGAPFSRLWRHRDICRPVRYRELD
ncbi:NUDIX domain-containing protein [uncultured Desulfosarcina sp.]|uniref:NUDIX hydrolase n=1 Tax=uncultured Desulfosarcina sp. TaxID=218289 RepID=UPI0029C6960D|nr:NUDIX domain-containing protein [uncultured Desulfosarcina sp.]